MTFDFMNTPEALSAFPVVTPIAVRWSDMDAGLIVNNVHYLRWLEIARTELLEQAGVSDFTGQIERVGVVVGKVMCTYIAPLNYPDTVLVGSRVKEIGEDRFVIENAIFSQKQQRLAAVGEVRLVAFDLRDMKKAPIPDFLRKGLPDFC
ncbi:MAG: thioesterase family protein [Bacteroidia bacterium]